MDFSPVETVPITQNIVLESIRDPNRRHYNDVWLVGNGKRLFIDSIRGSIKRKTIVLAKSIIVEEFFASAV